MKSARPLLRLVVFASVFALLAASVQARSSDRGNRGNRNSGPYRLIGGEDDDNTRGGKRDDTRKPDSPKKPEAPSKPATTPKPTAPKPTTPTVVKPPSTPKPTAPKPPKGPTAGPKADDALEQEAARLLAQANASFDQGTEAGLLAGARTLREILANYDGTAAAAKAKEHLELLLKHQEYGPMILLAAAQEEFDAQHYRKARNKFQELLARFPNSAQAAEARAKLEEIEKNDLLKKTVYTDEELEDARLWFLAGNIHLENGRKAEAASAYRRVIEEYPGCRYAVMAEEKLPGTRG